MGVQMFSCSFLLILLFFSNAMFCAKLSFVSAQHCVQSQKDLLLELKNNLKYNSSFSTKLIQWTESIDCCAWGGINCDSRGRAIGLDLSDESISGGIDSNSTTLFKLEFLQSLNLADNNFSGIQLPPGFGRLEGLRYLNLSNSYFSGQIPFEFSYLTKLVVLDLSSSFYPNGTTLLKLESPDLKTLIHNFTELRELNVNYVNISANGYQWCEAVSSSLPNLRSLSLVLTYISGPFDPSLAKLRSLSVIQLDFNTFSSPFPDFFADFSSLRILNLRGCNLSGVIPRNLFQIRSLQMIDFSFNEYLEGSLPEFPLNSTLQDLNLGGTNFSGSVPESIGNFKLLSRVYLDYCRFSGRIPNSFKNLTQLTVLSLSGNNFTGQISDSTWEGLENLVHLDLSDNSLEGEIPSSLFALPSLELLHLNHNRFSGSLDITNCRKLSNLTDIDLSHNNLFVSINQSLYISSFLPRLVSLWLASCNLQQFPPLQNISSLRSLDLSNNKLYGEIPNWIWELGNGYFLYLNLSHNKLTSMQEPYDISIHMDSLDLNSNMLSGRIPVLPSSLHYVDFSNNIFSSSLPGDIGNSLESMFFFSIANNNINGTIPPSLCYARKIGLLDLSNNSLHGRIPPCLVTRSRMLNLGSNNLSGNIPDPFSIDCRLETLDLSWNNLKGRVPRYLSRCSMMKVLNLGHNNLSDTFPCHFKNLSELCILELRSNKFHGKISCMLEGNYTWPNLQIIDLGSNDFNGVLPDNLFQNMKALTVDVNATQSRLEYLDSLSDWILWGVYDSISVTTKGQDLRLDKIRTTFTLIDFSNNHFEGVIQETIGELKSLEHLNFSHNALTGHIPLSVGKMHTLESLDLSFNHLDGEIPQQLASLTFLADLNLSYNKLVGRIPQGNQMTLFPESSFQGNEGLCGYSLNISCTGPKVQQTKSDEEHASSDHRGIYLSVELGFIVGLGALYAPLLFSRRWRRFFVKYLDKVALFILRRR